MPGEKWTRLIGWAGGTTTDWGQSPGLGVLYKGHPGSIRGPPGRRDILSQGHLAPQLPLLSRPRTLREKHLQFAHPLDKSPPPASLVWGFVVHKHLLTPICAPRTPGRRGARAFRSLLAHQVGTAGWVFLVKTNTNTRGTCVTGIE